MNTNNVKKYAPKARKAFIEAMSKQAAKYGITKKKIEPAEQKGDLVLIGDRPFPVSVTKPRERLVKRIEQQGFDQVMEHVAYSWFNRLCAIRYMERKGFLDHGRRVLSAADGSAGVPQILEECLDVELPGLDQIKVRELKLDGTKDEELYRELLLAQCHALHQAMPFLFEAVADESELLLPENLTKTDSLIRELVASVPDEDWDHIEIIGWLYQFYISEKKDQVMGKVVKSEDIPAATQLFTPNWIVQYLVQNSVGRQWLQTYPDSPLKEKMQYYIEPAKQTAEVRAQLAAITPKELKPEELSATDICCGSGHILIEAYKLFKCIYEERGYRTRDIPQLILEKNLFGLDIDDRAGQLAGFALMMLAREDDRRIFSRNIRLNILSLQESANVNLPSLWQSLNLTGEWQSGTSQGLFEEEQQDLSAFEADNRYKLLQRTLEKFKQAKTFGSLIDVPENDFEELKELFVTLCEFEDAGDSMQKAAAGHLLPFVHQAVLLAKRYDAVVVNPPYMGGKSMNPELKRFASSEHPKGKSDLFSMFMERTFKLLNDNGINAHVNMQSWMYLSSYEKLREWLLDNTTIYTMAHLGARAFSQISGEVVQTVAWVIGNGSNPDYQAIFCRLVEGNESDKNRALLEGKNRFSSIKQQDFKKLPKCPISYWIGPKSLECFDLLPSLGDVAEIKSGMSTSDNDRFLRQWYEVSRDDTCVSANSLESARESKRKWFPFNKGGGYKSWFGNSDVIVNWLNDGEDIKDAVVNNAGDPGTTHWSRRIYNTEYFFREGVTWSLIGGDNSAFRLSPEGSIYSHKGPGIFSENIYSVLAYLNSKISEHFLGFLKQGLGIEVGHVSSIPFKEVDVSDISYQLVSLAKEDWNTFEASFGFSRSPLIIDADIELIEESWKRYLTSSNEMCFKALEHEHSISNKIKSELGLLDEVSSEKSIENITFLRNIYFRYSGVPVREAKEKYRSETLAELVSYSVGCMFGRYSLDQCGLIHANHDHNQFLELVEGNIYQSFSADDDGIIPLTDQEWFPDDATNRFQEFVKVVWDKDRLQENLDFVAESLCLHAIKPKKSESSMDTIRRYLSTQFYKDHLKTYKKRPIYWLFSSGKQKAFECLVYLHRYNEGTLARMRTEYVIPLTAKMAAYAQKLENDKEASGSAAEVKRFEKEIAQLHKQQAELSEFDEKLRHYADQRISLDLDDGVKVNYGKFGDLLAEVKAITGEAPEVLS